MSLIYGVFDENQEKKESSMHEMFEGISHLPHEKHQLFVKENIGFGHLLTYNTPESVFEQQPFYETIENLLFACEGRLDNREELAAHLGIRLHAELSDGEIIKKAFLKWRKECPKYLRGDWSFAVFNFQENELFLARDQHGYTAIYYFFDDERFAFSSSPKAIFALKGFEKKINLRYFLGGLLLWRPEDKNLQSFENLRIVPPAHTLTFKNRKISINRYWFPENVPLKIYKNKADYVEELKEIFTKAVQVRLRSYRPVAAMLSGGLDSGSVASVAANLLKKEGKTLTTFSHVPLYKNEIKNHIFGNNLPDETPNILATANHVGNILPILLDSANILPTEGFIKALEAYDSLFHAACNAFWLVDLPTQVAKHGFGTLLTGEMGNATISFTGVDYLVSPFQIIFFKNPIKLAKRLAKPVLLKHFNNFFDNRKNNGLLSHINENYVLESVLESWRVREDIREKSRGFNPFFSNAKEGMSEILMIGFNPRCAFGNNLSNEYGIEKRDPTGDVEVIEHCLSIPNEVFFDENLNSKFVLKTMMKDILPDEVLFSKKKGLQAGDIQYRMLNDKEGINQVLFEISQNSLAKEFLNVEKMNVTWQRIQSYEEKDIFRNQVFLKALMYGYFLMSNSVKGPKMFF